VQTSHVGGRAPSLFLPLPSRRLPFPLPFFLSPPFSSLSLISSPCWSFPFGATGVIIHVSIALVSWPLRHANVTRTRPIFPAFAFKVMYRVILLTRFCKPLTTVAILSGGGGDTCLKCLNGTTPLAVDADCLWMRLVLGMNGVGCGRL